MRTATLFLYALGLYLLVIEFLYPFRFLDSTPETESSLVTALITHTKYLSLTLEVTSIFFLLSVQYWLTMTFILLPFARLSNTLRTRLIYLKKKFVVRPLLATSPAIIPYLIFLQLAFVNGMVFNRAEGTSIFWGAFEQLYSVYYESGLGLVHVGLFLVTLIYYTACCVIVIVRDVPLPDSVSPSATESQQKESGSEQQAASLTLIDKSLMLVSISLV